MIRFLKLSELRLPLAKLQKERLSRLVKDQNETKKPEENRRRNPELQMEFRRIPETSGNFPRSRTLKICWNDNVAVSALT